MQRGGEEMMKNQRAEAKVQQGRGQNDGRRTELRNRDGRYRDTLGQVWKWQDYAIRYQVAGDTGPALILIHGFGANCDHWRKNISVLASHHRVFAIDLLGYGYSDKPSPSAAPPNSIYNFENWANQVLAFRAEIVKDRAFLICNSVGGIVGLQAALYDSDSIKGLILLNISLRMLHIKKQQWFVRPFVRTFQNLLRRTDLGKRFFQAVATPQSVKKILCQCYHDDRAVTDDLVEKILLPGLQPGAVDVFLDFICYSGGPLPEEMLPKIKCPVVIGWGEKDPWEPIELGRLYGAYSCVEEFLVLPNVGHCPQDEAPHLVNPLIENFVSRHANSHCS
ncbi:hypothetical protein L7F22_016159 [Adiantum nelumboides]|nr:hypothetical protein [Adiantum nelumboides]